MDRLGRTDALETVLQRRDELHEHLVRLERALAAPAPGRADLWTKEVRAEIERLGDVWSVHVSVTEDPGGLYEEILDAAPRLSHQMDVLRAEHREVDDALDEALEMLDRAEPEEAREALLSLLGRLVRHRQRGADLLYEAYDVDLGGTG